MQEKHVILKAVKKRCLYLTKKWEGVSSRWQSKCPSCFRPQGTPRISLSGPWGQPLRAGNSSSPAPAPSAQDTRAAELLRPLPTRPSRGAVCLRGRSARAQGAHTDMPRSTESPCTALRRHCDFCFFVHGRQDPPPVKRL